MDVLSLLESQNSTLRRYLDASLEFVGVLESGDTSKVGYYQERREAILKAFDLFSRKAGEAASLIRPEDRTNELISSVRGLLDEKAGLLGRIADADIRIVELMEEECDSLRRNISSSRKSRDAISKFKSSWVAESGEGLDKTL